MTSAIQLSPADNGLWKKIFLVLSICIIVLMPVMSRDYGESGDEAVEIQYGRDIYNYFFNNDKQALDYTNKSLQYQHMELYGGFFDYYVEVIHHWVPSVNIVTLKNFCNAFLGALLMIFTGLLAFRLSKKWSVGVIALLFILCSPRILGESMNNPKDIPHACAFVIGIYGFLALLQDFPNKKWRHGLIVLIGFGMTFGSRPAGGLLQGCYFMFFAGLYYILNKQFRDMLKADKNKQLKQFVLVAGVSLLGGYILGLSAWPFGLQSPISHSIESLQNMSNRDVVLRVLFEGSYHYNSNMPWYYELKWIFISNPLIVLAGVLLFLLLTPVAIRQYGLFTFIILIFAASFPLLFIMYKHSAVYDTWRHVFFVYVYWAVIAALGWDLILVYIKNEKLSWLPIGIAIVGLLPALAWIVRSYPNTYVYFNELEGGVAGAYGNYDLDYYQNTNRQAANWILKNVKPVPGKKIIVYSDMTGFENFFANDTSWVAENYGRYNDRSHADWDYYIDFPRYVSAEQLQDGGWPPQNVVKAFTVDDVPLSVIIKNRSKDGIAAYDALQKKDFATAAALYASYIKTDTTDENVYMNYGIALASIGRIDEGIQAVNKATQIDPSEAQFFQILAQLYHAKGDDADAQKAMANAQTITMREQEAAGQ